MEPILVFPDPPPALLVQTLDLAGYAWQAVTNAAVAAQTEPREGWSGAIIAADEDPEGAFALCRTLRKRDAVLEPLLLLVGGAQLAELLGVPYIGAVTRLDIAGGTVKARRDLEGAYELVECALPAVLSIDEGIARARYPSLKGIMAAKSKPVDQVTAADLGVATGATGQDITAVTQAPERQAGEKIEDDGTGFERVVAFLEDLKVI